MAYTIGQNYGGGIIFYIDETGEHGLIAAPSDLGEFNLVDAINVCKASDVGGFKDWFLPDKDQLNNLYLQQEVVGGFSGLFYWSSSVEGFSLAWFQIFTNGYHTLNNLNGTFYVRAVRAF